MKINSKGFSLLELSVVLVIIGLMTSLGLDSFDGFSNARRHSVTLDRLKIIESAIDAFIAKNGRLPCPANMEASPSEYNSYDSEDVNVNYSVPDYNIDFKRKNGIRIGALPIKDLNLGLKFIADGWDDKFVYLVSEKYCNTENKEVFFNGIDENKDELINDKYVYAIISNGADRIGGFPRKSGKQISNEGKRGERIEASKNNIYGDTMNVKNIIEGGGNNRNCDDMTLMVNRRNKIYELGLNSRIKCKIEYWQLQLNKCDFGDISIGASFSVRDFKEFNSSNNNYVVDGSFIEPNRKIFSEYKDETKISYLGTSTTIDRVVTKRACVVECLPGGEINVRPHTFELDK
ncbi:hypothetical protein FACS1894152_5660 [Bacilli bacterium]|nr:hypothetical protein FACS1894152_5660 [Bacilli bacterium]